MTQLATPNPETAHGMILGTVQYMAPEQVEGKEADARSDIWALGAVIYEMVDRHAAVPGRHACQRHRRHPQRRAAADLRAPAARTTITGSDRDALPRKGPR